MNTLLEEEEKHIPKEIVNYMGAVPNRLRHAGNKEYCAIRPENILTYLKALSKAPKENSYLIKSARNINKTN